MIVRRNYNTKDVEMLITASAIVENAITHKAVLQTDRIPWADPYFDDLKSAIDYALQTYLGIDSAGAIRQATMAIKSIQAVALKDLAKLKVQITEDLKSNKELRKELLRQLGFTSYHKKAQNRNQESIIDLLYQFKLNLTPAVRTQLNSQTGIPDALLSAVIGYADHLKNANVGQERFKGARKAITMEAINAFNDIYDKIISISKIAAKLFDDNIALTDQFNFTKISKRLKRNGKKDDPEESPGE